MFFGREKELKTLNKAYSENIFQMVIMYGRRRVGKTTLLKEFLKDKNFILFLAEEANDQTNLQSFSKQIKKHFKLPDHFPNFPNWNDAFNAITDKAKDERIILVIDEYPYAALANKSLNSILQHTIDQNWKDTQLFLILCGSQISFMENEVMGYSSPLFGRRTMQMQILPFDFFDARNYFLDKTYEEQIEFYSAFGGTPYYLSKINAKLTFTENILKLFLETSGYLYEEPMMLLQQELREPRLYNTIISLIASGATTMNELSSKAKIDSRITNKYVSILMSLQILRRNIPFGADTFKSRNSRYYVDDNLYRFWFLFIFPNKGAIELDEGDQVLTGKVLPALSRFIGKPVFEDICLQWLKRKNKARKLPEVFVNFGSWWGQDKEKKKPTDVDIVASSLDEKIILLGECKWRNDINYTKEIEKLLDKKRLFPNYDKYYFYFFSKIPFSSQARKLEKEHESLKLIELKDLFSF